MLISDAAAHADNPALLNGAEGLLITSVIIIIGIFAGSAARKIKLPQLTGQIIAGIIIGPSVLNIIGHAEEKALGGITSFAIGLIALTVGSHLNFRRLHNALARCLTIAVFEASLAFFAVFFIMEHFNPLNFMTEGHRLAAHMIIASLACSTSPATILHVVKEKNAKGSLVKTLMVVVALDNIICLIVFETMRAMAKQSLTGQDIIKTALPGLISFIASIIIGSLAGWILTRILKNVGKKKKNDSHFRHHAMTYEFTLLVISIMITHGICSYITQLTENSTVFQVAPLPIMANMILGIVLANSRHFKESMVEEFDLLEQVIFTCFFTLAGMHLDTSQISIMTLSAAGAYLVAMASGKVLGATIGAYISRSTRTTTLNIGRMLLVQAGMTIALLVVIANEDDFKPIADIIIAVVLIIVVFTELIGTIFVSKALDSAKVSDKKRTRLIDFLEEEHIMVGLYTPDKWESIKELVYFLQKTHALDIDPQLLIDRVVEREEEISTAFGMGIAVPHAIIPVEMLPEDKIYGVLGIANPPVDFDAPDEEPTEIIILLLTPENKRDYHLEVISALARMLNDDDIRNRILKARTPASIYEIIHSEEAEGFNYFLKEEN